MADLDRVKRNVGRLISANADEADIDSYIASEGATLDQVRAHKVGATSPAQPKPQTPEQKAVADWRQQNPKTAYVRDVARNVVRGTGIGSFMDEAAAGFRSFTRGEPYDQSKRMIDAMDEASAADTTTLGTLPLIGDVTTSGLAQIASGVATAPFMPMARVAQGATLLPRVANALATGAGYGSLYGAGEGNSLEDRGGNALTGLAVGGALGAAAPVVGSAIGAGANAIRNRMQPLPRELQQFERPAIDRVRQVAEMDELTPVEVAAVGRRTGRQGMLADTGENLRTITEGLNQQPGPARATISEAMRRRQRGAPARLDSAVTDALGPPANIPQTVANLERQYGAQAAPLYDQFHNMQVPQTPQIAGIVERVRRSDPGLFNSAMRLAIRDGYDPSYITNLRNDPMTPMTGVQGQQQQRVWQGVELDYLKRALDDLARDQPRGSNEQRQLSNLARALRTQVDEAISPGAPDQSVWAQARQISGDGIRAEEAIEAGRGAFNRNLSADQLEADMTGLSALERESMTIGAREALRSNMANASTNFRENGDATARRLLNSPENRRKMEMLAPNMQGAQRLNTQVLAENDMAETFNQVMSNSATARRQAARDIIPRQYEAASMRELRGSSLSGAVAEGVGRLGNFLTAGYLNERNQRIASQMADMLVAQGVTRENIARGIIEMMNRQRLSAAQRNNVNRFAESLVRGSTPAAVDAATPPNRGVLRGSQMGQGVRE
jgi:hypothetical protein